MYIPIIMDMACIAEDGMATEDDEDDTDLPPPETHAEPASTAEAAQHAAQVAHEVKQAEIQERTRLEEDAIGNACDPSSCLECCASCIILSIQSSGVAMAARQNRLLKTNLMCARIQIHNSLGCLLGSCKNALCLKSLIASMHSPARHTVCSHRHFGRAIELVGLPNLHASLSMSQGNATCHSCLPVPSARLVAMREEKVENMAHEATPAPPKKQKRASASAAAAAAAAATASPSPSPYNTPPGSVGPTMSDDMYMLMDEEEKTSVSMSGGRSGARSDKELLKVVTDGDSYDDGYRYRLLVSTTATLLSLTKDSNSKSVVSLSAQLVWSMMCMQICKPSIVPALSTYIRLLKLFHVTLWATCLI